MEVFVWRFKGVKIIYKHGLFSKPCWISLGNTSIFNPQIMLKTWSKKSWSGRRMIPMEIEHHDSSAWSRNLSTGYWWLLILTQFGNLTWPWKINHGKLAISRWCSKVFPHSAWRFPMGIPRANAPWLSPTSPGIWWTRCRLVVHSGSTWVEQNWLVVTGTLV